MPIKVVIDYKSLEYIMTTKKLTRRQAYWAKFLSGFNFINFYIQDKIYQKEDLLTRFLNNLLKDNNNDR